MMSKGLIAFCRLAFSVLGLMPTEGKAQALTQSIVQIYCSVPGSSGGGTVYSYDGNGVDGKMIANRLTQPRNTDEISPPLA